MLLWRRHDLIGIGGENALNQSAPARITRHYGDDALAVFFGGVRVIQPQIGLTFFFIRPVAEKAVFREDGPDLAGKIHRACGETDENKGKEQMKAHEVGCHHTHHAPAFSRLQRDSGKASVREFSAQRQRLQCLTGGDVGDVMVVPAIE